MFVRRVAKLTQILGPEQQHPEQIPRNLEREIGKRYLGTMVGGEGLCVAIDHITWISGGDIKTPGGQTTHTEFDVRLKVVLLQPWTDEVLEGRVSAINVHGVSVDCELFSAFVPKERLPAGSVFVKELQEGVADCWEWVQEGQDADLDGEGVLLQVDDEVRFKCKFFGENCAQDAGLELGPAGGELVVGDMRGDGLGPLKWWNIERKVMAPDQVAMELLSDTSDAEEKAQAEAEEALAGMELLDSDSAEEEG